MGIFSKLFTSDTPADLRSMIVEGSFLVDVRTAGEFAGGHVKGSVNIPLAKLPFELAKFKDKHPIIVFCRSGVRSGQAKSILEQNGFTNVINGGTWENVSRLVK